MRITLFLALACGLGAQHRNPTEGEHKPDAVNGNGNSQRRDDVSAAAVVAGGPKMLHGSIGRSGPTYQASVTSRLAGPGQPARMTRLKEAVPGSRRLPAMQEPGWWQRHLGDTAIHGAATTADIISSRGMVELNPLLRDSRGQLGARGIAIKYGVFLGVESAKWALLRRGHRGSWVRSISLGLAGFYAGCAARNWRVR